MTTKQKIGLAVIVIAFFVVMGLNGRADIEARQMITGVPAAVNR
jgi:hypothetical protein